MKKIMNGQDRDLAKPGAQSDKKGKVAVKCKSSKRTRKKQTLCKVGKSCPRGKAVDEDGGRLTAGGNKPKRPWLPAEDELLRSLVNQHGPKSWSLIAKEMATRKGKQCRERWINHLDPRVRKGTFSSEEHKLIEEAVATIGHKWIEIAALLPGRTDNAIKNYWNSLLRHAQRSAKRKAMGKPLSGSTAKRSVAASRPLPPSLINSAGMPLTANGGLQKCDIRGEINLVKTVRLVGAV